MGRIFASGLLAALVGTSTALLGQGQQDQKPLAFEVASVKPSVSGTTAMRIIWPHGRFSAANASVRQLITAAFEIEAFQLEGAPRWVQSDRFDIEARVETEPAPSPGRVPEQIRTMMRTLLAERFRLATHTNTAVRTTYELVRDSGRSQLGPQLRLAATDCAPLMAAAARGAGPLPPPSQCGIRRRPGSLSVAGVPLQALVDQLRSSLQTMVVDRTGLSGNFDFDLMWRPDDASDSDAPSLFAAVQEQLGLKLQPTKSAVDVLVIDHVEHPTPD